MNLTWDFKWLLKFTETTANEIDINAFGSFASINLNLICFVQSKAVKIACVFWFMAGCCWDQGEQNINGLHWGWNWDFQRLTHTKRNATFASFQFSTFPLDSKLKIAKSTRQLFYYHQTCSHAQWMWRFGHILIKAVVMINIVCVKS